MLEFFASGPGSLVASIAILAVVFAGANFFVKKRTAVLVDIFQRLALKYNGTVVPAKRLGWPRLALRHDGIEAELFIKSRGGEDRQYDTVFSAVFPSLRPYKIRIYRERRVFGIGTVFGQDIATGNPEFDEAFVIQGTDETALRSILTPEVQMKVLMFKDLGVNVTVRDHKLSLEVPRFLKDEQPLDLLADAGLALVKKIKGTG